MRIGLQTFAGWAVVSLGLGATPLLARLPATPVIVGREAELDACTSIGHVAGLAARTVLPVHSRPAAAARVLDRLPELQLVWICEQRGHNETKPLWLGIIYQRGATLDDNNGVPASCGVDQPISHQRRYRGPCRSGWVPAWRIVFDAG